MRSRRAAALWTLAVAAVAAVPVAAAGPVSAGAPHCPASATKHTVVYVTRPGVAKNLVSLDLYVPKTACLAGGAGKAPAVMWVHGGGYAIGDKANQIADKVKLFTGRGYLFASVNYRLTTGRSGSARYPDHYRDVAAAVAWVRSHARSFGGDPGRIALLGHSAGADIVANVTTDPRWLRERRLSLRAVRCAGPLDTEGFDKAASTGDGDKEAWQQALGNLPDYERATSATKLVRRGIGTPATFTVTRGTARRQAIEQGFADQLKRSGVPVTVLDVRPLSHADVNRRIGAPGDKLLTPGLVTFLRGCLGR